MNPGNQERKAEYSFQLECLTNRRGMLNANGIKKNKTNTWNIMS